MPIRHRLIALITALAWLAVATPVAADCDPMGTPQQVLPTAEVAFVGRAVEVRGPVARFAVTEVWAGDVGPFVEVRGIIDQADPSQFGEDDRQWVDGATYLVIPFVDGPVLRDHICTATTEWTDELAALRPANAQIPATDVVTQIYEVPAWPILLGIAMIAVGGVFAFALLRQRR